MGSGKFLIKVIISYSIDINDIVYRSSVMIFCSCRLVKECYHYYS